ncbi:MAG: phenylalanine--tRNA ligase subunit beta [Alcanivoracaceae bacterium]|nr:phenylalanine--tRNA ligase subunit beta [Alcanivoracaceae bacterium]
MKLNESWLREWVNPAIGTDELVQQITMAGLEVDGVEPAAASFTGVVVAQVKSTRPHPDADKLTICEVDGGDGIYQVVCGAKNVRPELKIPFAKIGALLPGDFKIKPAKLRGEDSQGMLCGASELGLEDVIDGLFELPADAPVGTDIREYLSLNDSIIEVDLTPNRADCLSVRGIAREVGVLNRVPVTEPAIGSVSVASDMSFDVRVSASSACPKYLGRVIEGVDLTAATPLWMLERLRRAGLRTIDPVVDVTNYVLLELGQPLHAFDLAKITGAIDVRFAKQDEKITLLDGQEVTLRDDALVIADDSQALAFAGVMGGAGSAVSESTQNIFLECAFFAPLAIAGKARSYGLHTDSSHRFERGVDPALQEAAIERATALIIEIAGGKAGAISSVVSDAHMPTAANIVLRAKRIESLLGLSLPSEDVEQILTRLGMSLVAAEGGWQITAPSWRFDIEREEDLIEELARIYGYANLPTRLPSVVANPQIPEGQLNVRRLVDALQSRGYYEVITYSFVDPAVQSVVEPNVTPLPLANPISSELAVMRTSLWSGLLTCARYNLNRQSDRLRLFETGLRFVPKEAELVQEPMLAGLVYGASTPANWAQAARPIDFYDLKGDVEALLGLSGRANWQFTPAEHPTLHPGQSAQIHINDELAGWVGKLHPAVAAQLDLPENIYLFELRNDVILEANTPKFVELSDQPAVRRDLAFVLDTAIPAGSVLQAVRKACDSSLREVRIFDVYQGDRVAAGTKSLALGLTFQERSRTLREAEISSQIEAVVSLLKQEFNAHLRD